MTINEFKAWLEGYEASFANGAPNDQQWETIKKKLSLVATPATSPSLPTQLVGPMWAGDQHIHTHDFRSETIS